MRFAVVLALSLFTALPGVRAQREKLPPDDLAFVEKTWPDAKKTNTGIRYVIMQPGNGPSPRPGSRVAVLYEGRLLDGKIFDQGQDREHPFVFRVGRDEVIQGWDQILPQMKIGEKRLVIVPPEFGYGTRGYPPKIPRDATLMFVIELLEIRPDPK